MAKRIGLARTQALVQQLKRELTMGGTTFTNATIQGKSTSASGAGLQSGSIAAPVTRVTSVNGQIVTTIQLDLENLSGSNGAAGTVVGNPSGSTAAYLYQHADATHGKIYKVEYSCIESLVSNTTNDASFDLTGSTLGTYSHGDVPAADIFVVSSMSGSAITNGQTVEALTANSSTDSYVYLCTGVVGAGTSGQYDAGKLLIRLYGHLDF